MVSQFVTVYFLKRFLFVPHLFGLSKNAPLDFENILFFIFLYLSCLSLLMSQSRSDNFGLLIVLSSQYDCLSISILCGQTGGHWLLLGIYGDISSISL